MPDEAEIRRLVVGSDDDVARGIPTTWAGGRVEVFGTPLRDGEPWWDKSAYTGDADEIQRMDDAEFTRLYQSDFRTPVHTAARDRGRPILLRESVVAAKVIAHGVSSVLDVGCNEGHLCSLLAAQGLDVTAMDLDREIVKAALVRAPGAKAMVGLAEDLEHGPADRFDAVTCCEVVEHVRDPRRVVAALRHAAREIVVLTTPVGHDYDDPLHIHHWADEAELAAGLDLAGFKSFTIERIPSKIGDSGRVFVVTGVV